MRVLAAGTPGELDALLRDAAATVLGAPVARLPDALPRRSPAGAGADYASSLPMRLARGSGRSAPDLAAAIAAAVRGCPQVLAADVDGPGFVTLTLAPAVRVALARAVAADPLGFRAGPSTPALGPETDPETDPRDLADADGLVQARAWARADARRRIGLAAGRPDAPPRTDAPASPGGEVDWRDPRVDDPDPRGACALLLSVIGADSARVAFCRGPGEQVRPGERTGPDLPALPTAEHPGGWASRTDANPAFALRYAHAHAHTAHTRWAPALGRGRTTGEGEYPAAAVAALTEPAAAALLGALFDGASALHTAARRSEPHILVRYLEGLRAAYHEWWESRDVLGAATGPDDEHGTGARLDACAATAGVLRTGLSLLGVSAPTRP